MGITDIVHELYMRDQDAEIAEVEKQVLSVRIPATHMFLLQEMAERFQGCTRSGLGADFLEAAIEDAFATLAPKDRDALAVKADEAYKAFAEKAYAERGGRYESYGMGLWAGLAYAYTKAEERRAAEGEGQ